jgi:hypothetical protein
MLFKMYGYLEIFSDLSQPVHSIFECSKLSPSFASVFFIDSAHRIKTISYQLIRFIVYDFPITISR